MALVFGAAGHTNYVYRESWYMIAESVLISTRRECSFWPTPVRALVCSWPERETSVAELCLLNRKRVPARACDQEMLR